MPFTLLHMGPGLAIKALAGRHFSVLTFGVAQIVMDIEPLIGMMRGSYTLHGFTHTYLAALAIAGLVAAVSPSFSGLLLHHWNNELSFYRLDWLTAPESFSRMAVIAGALSGTLSHVMLDSIMHGDIRPFAPWSNANELLHIVSIETLHQWCIAAGLLGILGWVAVAWRGQCREDRG